jgi:TonB family protein
MPESRHPPGGIVITEPEYTAEAIGAKVEGFVALSVTVGEDGAPRDVTVVEPLGFGLDAKAVECVRSWRVPIPGDAASRVRLYVKFELPAGVR